MDTFLLFGLVGFACCILGVLGYTATTNKIIKEQEREIAALTTENKRLKTALKAKKKVKVVTVSPEPSNNAPSFKEW